MGPFLGLQARAVCGHCLKVQTQKEIQVMSASKPYARLAEVWDQMGQDEHSKRMVEYVLDIFDKAKFSPESGLDLCCGTGTAIKMLTEQGIDMAGVDGSAEMLNAAHRKLRGTGADLYHQILPKLKVQRRKPPRKMRTFDFVVSFYDSLNYLETARKLGETFKAVNKHLNPKGYFIFDMNTAKALSTIWDSQIHAEVRDDLVWVFRNQYNAKRGSATVKATFFVNKGKRWERFDEDHTEYAYSNTHIRTLLRQAGFKVEGIYRCYTMRKASRDTERICVVARKSSKK
ncbi:methyltransferase domain-containing protein [candidate division GN15 bacterium]|nr:methyltransferase domain-containing protein [candidate division GN15 bacterium]